LERYICIHGHFYQPPRENPWLESIELEDSAYPYHDWNERIRAECYAPNGASRILNGDGKIVAITNNYSRISFNFGPTLMQWLAAKAPHDYQTIIAADHESQSRFSGHGSALAQPYNHMIMPLASRRDKLTQVLWGVRDFEFRFGRRPEGMWLPEAAVDLETLDVMASVGLRFTLLSPHQADSVRPIGRGSWRDVSGGRIDPSTAYRVRLPSGRKIVCFFYDGHISSAVAFGGLLDNGQALAERLVGAFNAERPWPQLVHIATDGETYGHHHRQGEMALAYALKQIEEHKPATLTNYGEFLEKHPPTHEVKVIEDSSWSCIHGIERWRSDCGCCSGGRPAWTQAWRQPLREAFDWLRDHSARIYEEAAAALLKDPWAARNDYVEVILDRHAGCRDDFLRRHARHELGQADQVRAAKLLELQRHAMLMYTSCGWFFDDLSGIETVQVIQYAGRVVQLAAELGGDSHLESEFLSRLERAKSNLREQGDGRAIYERSVRPAIVDLPKVAANYAVASLFEAPGELSRIHCYTAQSQMARLMTAGRTRLAVGTVAVASEVTGESATFSYGVLHVGDHNVSGGIRCFEDQGSLDASVDHLRQAFERGDVAELVRALDRQFGSSLFSLRLLFRDEQRRVLRAILDNSLADTEAAYRQIYQTHAPFLRFISSVGMPLPKSLELAAEFTLNMSLRRELGKDDPDAGRIQALLEEAQAIGVPLDAPTLEFVARQTLERLAASLLASPRPPGQLERLDRAVGVAFLLPFEVVLWSVQNGYYQLAKGVYPEVLGDAAKGDGEAARWVERFRSLGARLKVHIEG
jgi:alpha-amylase/alpha-mannosidase (GH57 family)